MENDKMMSKWGKWGIGTMIAIVLCALAFFGLSPTASFIGVIWVAFSISLFYSENEPFLPSRSGNIKVQILHAIKFVFISDVERAK